MIHFMQFVKHLGSVRFPYWLFSHFPAQDFLCRIFQSCIFTSCIFVPHFPVSHFPAVQFCVIFSIPAFSSPAFFLVPHFHVSHFQSPRTVAEKTFYRVHQKNRITLSAAKCRPMILVYRGIRYMYMRKLVGVLRAGGVKRQWVGCRRW